MSFSAAEKRKRGPRQKGSAGHLRAYTGKSPVGHRKGIKQD